MTYRTYLLRSLWHHRAAGAMVALGVAVATAAITGALVVNESVRASVRSAALARLGATNYVLTSTSLFPDDLGERLRNALPAIRTAAPVLATRGAAQSDATGAVLPTVSLFGIDRSFFALFPEEHWPELQDGDAAVGESLARALHVRPGDDLLVTVARNQTVALDNLFAHRNRKDAVVTLRVTVRSVLREQGAGGFSVGGSGAAPANIFVSRPWLAEQMRRSGRSSLLLLEAHHATSRQISAALAAVAVPADYGLKIVPARGALAVGNPLGSGPASHASPPVASHARRTLSPGDHEKGVEAAALQSDSLLIRVPALRAADEAARRTGVRTNLTSVFLASTVRCTPSRGGAARSIPYAVVAGLFDTPSVEAAPADRRHALSAGQPLDDTSILLNRWAAEALGAAIGDRIELECPVPLRDGVYATKTYDFTLRGIVPMHGMGADPGLTPDFEGITDAKSMSDWNPPFPVDLHRITGRDEDYWNRYRAAPKAFVNPRAAGLYWASAAGGAYAGWVTSVRLMSDSTTALPHFQSALMSSLAPADVGMALRPVRDLALRATEGSSEFSGIFLGMGLFVILSGAALAGMLMRLSVERRASEIGLLLACGFGPGAVRRLLFAEGSVLAGIGAVAGGPPGILYGGAIVHALSSWFGSGEAAPLQLHIATGALLGGILAGFLVGLASLALVVHQGAGACIPALLAGWQGRPVLRAADPAAGARRARASSADAGEMAGGPNCPVRREGLLSAVASEGARRAPLVWLLLAAATLALIPTLRGERPSETEFFAIGACLLVAGLVCCDLTLFRALQCRRGVPSFGRIALRNAAVHRGHSLLAAGLVASSAFLLVTVAANVRDYSRADTTRRDSGSGGFSLVATSSVPLALDFGTPAGRARMGFSPEDEGLFRDVRVVPLLAHAGDDVSCLNLARPVMPRVLGASREMIERGGFTILPRKRAESNPWRRLSDHHRPLEPYARSTPAFGDAESVEWVLHSGPGELYPIEEGESRRYVRFVGLIESSIFASDLIVSADRFHRLFPGERVPTYFLIATPVGMQDRVADALRRNLGGLGLDVRRTRDILNAVAAVQNAYLSSFLALGGLGMLLGTLGLATVLLRNARERRAEFAALLAMGFERRDIARILVLETGALLVVGAIWGALTAVVAILPHLMSSESRINGAALGGMLFAIAGTGLLACALSAEAAARGRLVDSLRAE